MHGHSTQLLLRIVADLERKPAVQTCRGISTDDPWYLAYLAVLGDLSPLPDPMNTWNDLRSDLTYQDVLTIRGIEQDVGAETELIHHPRREVFDHHVGLADQLLDQANARIGLQVVGSRVSVRPGPPRSRSGSC